MDETGGYTDYPFVADFYDHVTPYAERNDINFFVDIARESGGSVLEIGCGSGRVLIPTARAGISITGLDLSEPMLDKCREYLSHDPHDVQKRVRLIQGDMRNFDLGEEFALITTPFRPFQHLTTVDDQMSCLAAVHRHLKPDGKFVLDIFNPSIPIIANPTGDEEQGDEPEFEMLDGRRVIRRFRDISVDYLEQVKKCEMIYYVTYPDGRKERLVHKFPMRYIFRYEAEHLLVRCGFEVEHLYGGFDKSPYGSDYPGELIFVARKQNP